MWHCLLTGALSLAPSPYEQLDAIRIRAFSVLDAGGARPVPLARPDLSIYATRSPYTALDAIKAHAFSVLDAASDGRGTFATTTSEPMFDITGSPQAALQAIESRASHRFAAALAQPINIPTGAFTVAPTTATSLTYAAGETQAKASANEATHGSALISALVGVITAIAGYELLTNPAVLSWLVTAFTNAAQHIDDSIDGLTAAVQEALEAPRAADQEVLVSPSMAVVGPPMAVVSPGAREAPGLDSCWAALPGGGLLALVLNNSSSTWPDEWNIGPRLSRGLVRICAEQWADSPGQARRAVALQAKIASRVKVIGACGVEVLRLSARGLEENDFGGRRDRAMLTGMLQVDEAFQRQGVAQRLLRAAEAQARLWGVGEMLLIVKTRNTPALRLYRKMGYTETGCWKDEVCLHKFLFSPSLQNLRAMLPQRTVVRPRWAVSDLQ